MEIHYQWYRFDELTALQLYNLLRLRSQIFVVEQSCIYMDCDDRDQTALHGIAWLDSDQHCQPVACIRLLPPAAAIDDLPSLGRLATDPKFRGRKLATRLLLDGLRQAHSLYPGKAVLISAQLYLQKYYERQGFAATSVPYDEDGITHIKMIQFPKS